MSSATATDAMAPKKGRKKLIIIATAVLLLLLGGGGAAALMMKNKAAAEAADEDRDAEPAARASSGKRDPHAIPTFVPLEPFTVNLADRDAERYAQVGMTLEVGDPKVGEQIKLYMPAIRNNILMALADKTAAQLMERNGKTALAEQVKRETARALGVDVPEPDAEDSGEEAPPKKKKGKKAPEPVNPVHAVHFSNFIIQ